MKKKILKFILWVNLFAFSSCGLDGLQTNPALLTPDQANIDFLLNSVELQLANNFNALTSTTMDLTRMKALINGANYSSSYTPASFDGVWTGFYSTLLPDVNTILKLGTPTKQTLHTGIARAIKAYSLVTMVDMFGDIPYSQALDINNFNPKVDKGQDLYDTALNLMDRALVDLATKPSGGLTSNGQGLGGVDFFYGGSATKWITFVKSLKLRTYLQRSLVDTNAKSEIQAIIDGGDVIDDPSKDFGFTYYGNSITNPDTRTSYFTNNYLNGGSDYMSNSLMLDMYNGRNGYTDPRIRYYFYRQTTTNPTDVNILPCAGVPAPSHYQAGTAWCIDPEGYFGRDHMNNDGIGPDTKARTIWGIYPFGGKFDADDSAPGAITDGNQGKGILPIMNSSFVYFMRAEAALRLGTNDDPRAMLQAAVTQSIDKVMNFATVTAKQVPKSSQVSGYIAGVLSDYDNAASTADKLQVVIKQYWIALFGNGIDMYNTYRRTGFPRDMQPARNPTPGDFYRSLIFPSSYITRNSNAAQHDNKAQVFWDTNTASVNPSAGQAGYIY